MIERPHFYQDSRGDTWADPDHAAAASADYAAERGVWTDWAQPGSEASATQIGVDARQAADELAKDWEAHLSAEDARDHQQGKH